MTARSDHGIGRIEQAATQQVRALDQLREVRALGTVLSEEQQRTRWMVALGHLAEARRLLEDAHASAWADARLTALLDDHRERLTRLADAVTQLARREPGDDGRAPEPLL